MPDPDSPTLTFTSPLSPTDPIFSLTALPTTKALTNTIRRQTRTLRNRLHSIHTDSLFVTAVARAYGLPLLTNSRAGDWYVDPRHSAGSVYFKSTDGHTGQWRFSLRRLNYQLLTTAGTHGGAVVVDSTRRGKRFPDALTKTLPIYLAVLNACLFPDRPVQLHTHPSVPASEHAQILQRVPAWREEFLRLQPDLRAVRAGLCRPLRPLFVAPDSTLPDSPPVFEEFTPIVCCTASRMVVGDGVEGEYIQGAGDDHEGWSGGLTPALFWQHSQTLLDARDDTELEALVQRIVSGPQDVHCTGALSNVQRTKLWLGPAAAATSADARGTLIIDCTPTQSARAAHATKLPLPTHNTKPELKRLRTTLPGLLQQLEGLLDTADRVVIVDATSGDEVAPVVALAVLCTFYGEDRELRGALRGGKDGVRKRLSWIVTDRASVKPARVGLNAVNEVVLR